MNQSENIAIFIDGNNLYYSLKKYHLKIKIEEIIKIFSKLGVIRNILYYTARLDPKFNKKGYLKHEKFIAEISKIEKLKVVLCNLRKITGSKKINYIIKRDDIRLANDIIVGAYENFYDIAIIISGDEDFVPVIKTAQRLKKQVINAYFPKTSSYLLRKACNYSINLKDKIKESKGRKSAPDDY